MILLVISISSNFEIVISFVYVFFNALFKNEKF